MMASGMGGNIGKQYRWFWGSLFDIVKHEGWKSLYRGVGPTTARATVLAAAELSSYDDIKQRILRQGWLNEGLNLHFTTACCAGFIAAFACNPFDVAKSRVMNQPVDPNGKGTLYKNMLDCFTKTIRYEGVRALWKGFIPAWTRVGPRVIIIFICMEQFKKRFDD